MKETEDEDVFNRLKQKQATSDFFWAQDDASEDDIVF